MKKIVLLKKAEIKKQTKTVSTWTLNSKQTSLQKIFKFKDHIDAMIFVARVTVLSQVLEHHPEMLFTFQKVKVTLTSHDIGGLSKLDFDLAKRIDSLHISG